MVAELEPIQCLIQGVRNLLKIYMFYGFLFALILLFGVGRPASAQTLIIDHAFETSRHIPLLKEQGVQVIGRYYARCVGEGQWESKRMTEAEVNRLLDAGFAILSIYQYWNNSEIKFDGLHKFRGETVPNLTEDCTDAEAGRSAGEEGRLDAEAAVRQARAVGQPLGTAIYFGVDFSFPYREPRKGEYTDKMLEYFRVVRLTLNHAGYKLGSYGNGYAHSILLREGLVDFTWLSPSQAHLGSVDFYRSREWNLFQYNVDVGWPKNNCSSPQTMRLDVNVQNPLGPADIGFWVRGGPFVVAPAKTLSEFERMRFVCDTRAIVRDQDGNRASATLCKENGALSYVELPHGAFVETDNDNELVPFNMDGDNRVDGFTKSLNLSDTPWDRPKWNRTRQRLECS